MKNGNVSIFIPHNGCPHQCVFCNQKNITGHASQPSPEDVKAVLNNALNDLSERARLTEIAFFGGSFTAIDRSYMLALLKAAEVYLPYFGGIRVSTRPDCIDREVLALLKKYGVTSIELGAQSMVDSVLLKNERGHSSDDVKAACELIKSFGFSLGLQMMTGMYGSDFDKDLFTAAEFIKLSPDTVRIYPTVIMKDTTLADLFSDGSFKPYTLEQSVDLCARLIPMFENKGITILRVGLHYSDSLISESLGDNYHPAFKELCESRIFYNSFLEKTASLPQKEVVAYINIKSLSKFLGQKKSNLNAFKQMGYTLEIRFDNTLGKYDLYISTGVSDEIKVIGNTGLQDLSGQDKAVL